MTDKWAVLKDVETKLNKQFSTTSSIVRLGSKVGIALPSIETGITSLDRFVIGTGGLPKGRIIEIFGPNSAGKTSLILHIIGQEQKRGNLCAFIDAEHSLDPTWAKKLGVDVDNLAVSQPDNGEQALETAEALIDSKVVSLIVIDSVAALVPAAEISGEMGDSHMGLQARLMSQAMRKLIGKCAANNVTLVLSNQLRDKLGVIYGSPEVTTGGNALKFYASVRLDVRRRKPIKNGEEVIGHEIEIKAVKNKVGIPFRSCMVDLIYAVGFNTFKSYIEYAIEMDVIDRAGSWFKFEGKQLGQGLDSVIEALKANKSLTKQIDSAIIEAENRRKENV